MDRHPLRDTLLLLLSGLGILALFAFGKVYLGENGFQVAHHLSNKIGLVRLHAALAAGSVIALWYALKNVRAVPPKLWLAITAVIFTATSLVAIGTRPTRSQDLYFNLALARGLSQYGLNPYQTTPELLRGDSWTHPVPYWRDKTEHNGPLSVLFFATITFLSGDSLESALVAVKTSMTLLLIVAALLFWKVMELQEWPAERKMRLLTLLAWNPFIIQNVLVDGHNDVFILLALLAGYFFLLEKQYAASTAVLILGGLFKHVSWLLLPVPLFYAVKNRRSWRDISSLSAVVLAGSILVIALYAFFGSLPSGDFPGITWQLTTASSPQSYLPGALLLAYLFGLDSTHINVGGLVLAPLILLLGLWLQKGRLFLSFTVPYLAVFFFGNAFFGPWYVLWILPLLALWWSPGALAVLSALLLLTPDVADSTTLSLIAITFCPSLILAYYLLRWMKRRRYTSETSEAIASSQSAPGR